MNSIVAGCFMFYQLTAWGRELNVYVNLLSTLQTVGVLNDLEDQA